MRRSWLQLLLVAILILALASCLGGGGTNDNQAAGVEPAGQPQDGEVLSSDNFDLPTEDVTDDLDFDDFDLTGTPDAALFGTDETSDDSLFDGDVTESPIDLFDAAETATPAP